jgi:starvation-inducible DNA-binding protein
MYATRIDVSISVREKVVPLLQAHLTNCVDLFTQVKQAHWNVKGPHFIALHELFDRIAEIVEQQSDVLAERINALGGRANAEDGPIYVAAVADKLSMFGKRVRIDICCAAKFGDAGTADILTEISREIDRQLWSLDAHLQAER